MLCPECFDGNLENLETDSDAGFAQVGVSTFSLSDILVMLTALVSIAVIYGVPSMGSDLIWADWAAIPLLNYVRIVAAVLLTTFLPGYLLLGVLDIKRQFRGIEVVSLACLLSLFLVPLSGAVTSAVGLTLANFGSSILTTLNFAVALAFLIVRVLTRPEYYVPNPETAVTKRQSGLCFHHCLLARSGNCDPWGLKDCIFAYRLRVFLVWFWRFLIDCCFIPLT